MKSLIGAVLCALLLSANVQAQSCPKLGFNTVEDAENAFYRNQKIEARNLLNKAYNQCRNNGPVLRRIAEAFRMIGDDSEADRFTALADQYGAKPIARITAEQSEVMEALPTFIRHKYALVVGVSHFKDFTTPNKTLGANDAPFQRVDDLIYAAQDARDFASLLTDPQLGRFQRDRVELLVDSDVTAGRVRRAIAKIEQMVTEDDLVVLFFSSHGSSPEMDPAASTAKSGFIVMHDTEYRRVLDTATAYPMYELVNAINRFRARRVIAFLDTCYSGDTVNARGARSLNGMQGSKGVLVGLEEAEQITKQVPQDRARVVITSSNSKERSWEAESIGHGYFTKYLLEALSEEGGQWNISQVYRFLNEKVPVAVEREKNGAQQHPQLRAFPDPRHDINIVIGTSENEMENMQ
jgi:uncharacterized caspase-like protein